MSVFYFLCYKHNIFTFQLKSRCIGEMELPAARTDLTNHVKSMDDALEQHLLSLKNAVEEEKTSTSNTFALLKSKHEDIKPVVNETSSALEEDITAFDKKSVGKLHSLTESLYDLRCKSELELHTVEKEVDQLSESVVSFLREDVRPTPTTGQYFFLSQLVYLNACYIIKKIIINRKQVS